MAEIQSRVYDATWRLDSTSMIAKLSLAGLVLCVGYYVLATTADNPVGGNAPLLLIFPAAIVLMIWLTVKQRRTQSMVSAGTVPQDAYSGAMAPSAVGEALRYWTAPIMRVQTAGAPMTVGGWSGPDALVHDKLAQNTLVVSDQAVYQLCILPHEQQAVLSNNQIYDQVKMGLFMSGTTVRTEADRRLRTDGLAAVAASDGRNVRTPLSDLTAIRVYGPQVQLVGSTGTDTFVLNHADAATAMARELSTLGLPVQWTPLPADTSTAGAPSDGSPVAALAGVLSAPSASLPPSAANAVGTAKFVYRAMAGIATFVGLMFIMAGVLAVQGARDASTMTGSAQGTVTSLAALDGQQINDGNGRRAVVQYRVAGRTYETSTTGSGKVCPWQVGQTMPVQYRPTAPGDGQPANGTSYLAGIAFAVFGLGALGIGLVMIFAPGRVHPVTRTIR